MSEQDDATPGADVIEHGAGERTVLHGHGLAWLRRVDGGGRRRLVIALVAVTCALAGAGVSVALAGRGGGPRADAQLAGLVTAVTTVPVGKALPASSTAAGAYAPAPQAGPGALKAVSGPPLTRGGKPELLYVGTEYCPYCAMETWPLIVALSRFGTFTGLSSSRTPKFDGIAPVDSWTFYGSRYTSPYLSFVPVERYSNVLVNPRANADAASGYRPLQPLTPAQQATMARYDTADSTPFLDFADRAAQVGSGPIAPQLMTGKSWAQLAAALRQPSTALGGTLLTEADTLTAELCRLTGNRPAAACPAFLRNLRLAS
jgi:hypothetical protein